MPLKTAKSTRKPKAKVSKRTPQKAVKKIVSKKPKRPRKPSDEDKIKKLGGKGVQAMIEPLVEQTGGRPKFILPHEAAEAMGYLGARQEDLALIFGVSRMTIIRYFEDEDSPFVTLFKRGEAKIRSALQMSAIQKALFDDNTPMHIFALKNFCGWTDKVDGSQNSTVRVVMQDPNEVPRYLQNLTPDAEQGKKK